MTSSLPQTETIDRGGSPIRRERLERKLGPALELWVHRPAEPATGAPVLFLHGAFAGAWCWEGWMRRVGGIGRHAAAVSLRGHGGSEGRDEMGWAGLTDFAADLALAIAAMPAPPVVVAHSFGGLLAQQLLANVVTGSAAPPRGLVLVGSLPPEGLALIAPWVGLSAWGSALTRTVGLYRGPAFKDRDAIYGDGSRPAAFAAAFAALAGEAAFTGLAQAMIPRPAPPAWSVGVPALVLHGAGDPLVDAATAARTALYHGAAYTCIEQAGHFPMLGRRAEAGADALCGWLVDGGLSAA